MEPINHKKQVTNSLEGFLETAFDYIEENRFYQAREIFQQLLKQIPDQPNCLFGLGIICFRHNDFDEAKKLFSCILTKYPDSIGPLEYMALIQFNEQNWSESIAYAKKLIEINPKNAIYHRNLAHLYKKQKKYSKSIEHYLDALENNPNYAECLMSLGFLYKLQGNLDESKKCFEKSIALFPNLSESLIGISETENKKNGFENAKPYYDRFFQSSREFQELLNQPHFQKPTLKLEYETFLFNLGTLYFLKKMWSMSQHCFESALLLNPNYPEALMKLGESYKEQHEKDLAKACYENALKLKEDYPECLKNLGNLYYEENDLTSAKWYYEKALSLSKDYAECMTNLGSIYHAEGDFKNEEKVYFRVLSLHEEKKVNVPDFVYETCKFNLGILQLLQAKFQEGWKNYDSRKRVIKEKFVPSPNTKFWDGKESLNGKEILVIYEKGYGDYIQFIRLGEILKKQGAYVNAICSPQLKDVIKSILFVDSCHDYIDDESKNDRLQVLILDLPKYLNIDESNIPNEVPYIFADNDKSEFMKKFFKSDKPLNVGICYRGSTQSKNDRNRSIELKNFLPLLKLKDVHYYNITLNDPNKEFENFKENVIDLSQHIKNFSDTAAIINNLDLLISVDTAAAHLAGAMNKPCWLLLPKVPDWRWQLNRNDSPWYPSFTLFRQEKETHWDTVISHITHSLKMTKKSENKNGRKK